MKGLWKLVWVEAKVFMREPMGIVGTLVIPALLFVVLGGSLDGPRGEAALEQAPFNFAILVALFIAISAVMSLVTIITIYRENGILKRLRATPLSPLTILGAHVIVQLGFTAASLGILVLVGRQVLPGAIDVGLFAFTLALLISTLCILSLGFVIASVVPTTRFARPIVAFLLYPMVGISGLFFPLDQVPTPIRTIAQAFPTTHAVSLMTDVWDGAGWNLGSTAALAGIFALCVLFSSRAFRWE